MTDKNVAIAAMIVAALRDGYKVTIERNDIGVAKHGVHIHVGFVDELIDELKDVNPWDYINQELTKDINK